MYCVIVWNSCHGSSGSQILLRGSQGIRDQFPGDPRLHFCNDYCEVYLFFNLRNNVLLNIMEELLQLAVCLYRMTVTISNLKKKNPVPTQRAKIFLRSNHAMRCYVCTRRRTVPPPRFPVKGNTDTVTFVRTCERDTVVLSLRRRSFMRWYSAACILVGRHSCCLVLIGRV